MSIIKHICFYTQYTQSKVPKRKNQSVQTDHCEKHF